MHESGIAASLLELTDQVVRDNHLARVTEVRVRIGRFSGVQPEALRFAWEVLRQGTRSAGAVLKIEEVPIRLRCRSCESDFAADPDDLSCPLCQGLDVELLSGREMSLQSVLGETENDT